MAETYKGLTIRIGGDTTRLQSALRSADSAISNTQRQLRAMTRRPPAPSTDSLS